MGKIRYGCPRALHQHRAARVERDAERVELVVKLGRARQLSTGARARDHVSSL